MTEPVCPVCGGTDYIVKGFSSTGRDTYSVSFKCDAFGGRWSGKKCSGSWRHSGAIKNLENLAPMKPLAWGLLFAGKDPNADEPREDYFDE